MYLCLSCQAKSDTKECEWCGEECVEVSNIATFEIEYKCEQCQSLVIKKTEWFEDEIPPLYSVLYCPICKNVTTHSSRVINIKNEEYSDFLVKAYLKELKHPES